MTRDEGGLHPTLHKTLWPGPGNVQTCHLNMSSDCYKVHSCGPKRSLIHLLSRDFTSEQASIHAHGKPYRQSHVVQTFLLCSRAKGTCKNQPEFSLGSSKLPARVQHPLLVYIIHCCVGILPPLVTRSAMATLPRDLISIPNPHYIIFSGKKLSEGSETVAGTSSACKRT